LGAGIAANMTTGAFNTFVGNNVANLATVTGNSNICLGQTSLRDLTTGNANCIIGRFGGHSITTGSANTFIGNNTGISTNKNLTGSNNTTLGMDVICGVDGLSYACAIGSGASVGTSNTIVLGRATDAINVSGDLILTNASPVINTSTPAAFLDIKTATGGTGYLTFSPRGTLAFQIEAAQVTSLVGHNFQNGFSMTAGTANLTTSTVTCGAITTSGNLTLKTSGSAPTAGTQLGGTSLVTVALTTLASGTFRSIQSATLPIGTYIFNGSVTFYCTAIGATKFMSAGFNTANSSFAAGGTQLGNSTTQIGSTENFVSTAQITSLSSSCVVTVTTAAIYYFNAYWLENALGIAFTVGLTASFTRIA
jgi:hypothetical protein